MKLGAPEEKQFACLYPALCLLCLRAGAWPGQEAFERLRRQFLTPIGAAELLKAKADIEALRFPMWQEPPLDATRLSREAQQPEREINRAY